MRALLVALLLMIPVAFFFACFEKREVEVASAGSREARANRFLAFERLLSEMGHPVRVLSGPEALEELPPTRTRLLLLAPRGTYGERRTLAVLDWVARGGHLVLAGPGEGLASGPIAERLSLGVDFHADEEQAAEEETGATEQAFDPTWIAWPDVGAILVGFDPHRGWRPREEGYELEVLSAGGVRHLVQLAYGDGSVTALTDAEFLANHAIGEHSHGKMGLLLARAGGDPAASGEVWLVIGESWPSLLQLLAAHALPVVVGLGVFLVALVWRASRRFGPTLPVPEPVRRSWLEHLEAVGQHHWREDRGQQLLLGLVAGVRAALELRHPSLARLPAPELCQRLAQGCGLRPSEVHAALADDPPSADRASFIARVAHLERIRACL